eukprot:9434462-Pyramimonas_sp.AAC.1
MPVFAAGDINMPPSVIKKTSLIERRGFQLLHSPGPTLFTKRSRSELDYFVASRIPPALWAPVV